MGPEGLCSAGAAAVVSCCCPAHFDLHLATTLACFRSCLWGLDTSSASFMPASWDSWLCATGKYAPEASYKLASSVGTAQALSGANISKSLHAAG